MGYGRRQREDDIGLINWLLENGLLDEERRVVPRRMHSSAGSPNIAELIGESQRRSERRRLRTAPARTSLCFCAAIGGHRVNRRRGMYRKCWR